MSPSFRKVVLAVHLTLAVGWIGALAAYLSLDIATAISRDAQTLRAAYIGMDVIVRYVIVPFALATLLTGLIMSLGTTWGLFRHYWVLISFLLTTAAIGILLTDPLPKISSFAQMALDPTTSVDKLRASGSTLFHSIGGGVVLLVILVINVFKPQGMTRYGRRMQREERTRRERQLGIPR